ncbi:MAG: DNA adenine methylase [Chloroflexi bacterium]|nr:DNA adenine methylase [Chloroflexota bacterium]
MKYMGSKRTMLQNGLGKLLRREVSKADRFVDLFAGSGAVAIHVAREVAKPVLAFDLQRYSTVLASAVLHRQARLDGRSLWLAWHRRAVTQVAAHDVFTVPKLTQALVASCRAWSAAQADLPVTRAYGGHYFSPKQTVWIDALRSTLPAVEPARTTALAALIQAASQCAAAPGHTAQPFQPTPTAKRFLEEAWGKDVVARTRTALESLAEQFAQRLGQAAVGDANQAAEQLREGDLAFIDPPYSGVHYSRFYHVLETIAQGECGEVSGVGRYPAPGLRPRSKYSVISESANALDDLLKTIAARGARGVLTFPDHICSNGLSGQKVQELAKKHFRVTTQPVESRFSTLGGRGDDAKGEAGRVARKPAKELMLVLNPRRAKLA